MNILMRKCSPVLALLGCVILWGAASQPAHAAEQDLQTLNGQEVTVLTDEELSQVSAGDLQMSLEDLDVFIHNNEAGLFTMDIATSAFENAQGVFTTLMAVNSAVDLTVVVNIFFNQSP